MHLLPELQKLGLTEKEAKVYLAGVKLGPTNVLKLSKESGLKRGTVYEVINTLKHKELFSETKANQKRLFVAADPNALKVRLNDQEIVLDSIFPILRSISNVTEDKPRIFYHETLPEIRQTYFRLLAEQPDNSEIVDVASSAAATELGIDAVDEFAKLRAEKGIKNRVITDSSVEMNRILAKNEEFLRESRYLPTGSKMNIHYMIFHNRVYLSSYEGRTMGLLIEDKKIAESMRLLFEVMWQGLPEVE